MPRSHEVDDQFGTHRVWKNVKHDTAGRHATTSPEDFTARIITALERLTRLPSLIRAFFADPHLRYITA
jgi:hypothetical protein